MSSRLGDIAKGGIKTPVVCATTANITLSGLQTIDGIAVTEGQRVLVKNQTTTTENGIYDASASAWTRSADWNDSVDLVNGVLVLDANDTTLYRVTFSGSYVIGTTVCTFTDVYVANAATAEAAAAAAQAAQVAAELAETNAELAETNAETAETNAETAAALFPATAGADRGKTLQSNNAGAAFELKADEIFTAGGTANALTVTSGITSYVHLQNKSKRVRATANITGACTINFDSLGVVNIKTPAGNDPAANDIRTGGVYEFLHNGTNAILVNYIPDSAITPAKLSVNPLLQVNTYIYTSNNTFTPDPKAYALEIEAVAAGGGGGGIDGQGAGTAAVSVGGSAGGYARKRIEKAAIEASYAIVIGVGGVPGAAGNNPGGDGGNTTVIGSVPTLSITCTGGLGGTSDLGSTSGFKSGRRGGISTGGDINCRGGASTGGSVAGGQRESVSTSGCSYFGGGEPPTSASTGYTSTTPGAGGGAVCSADDGGNFAGGAGGPGLVIIREFVLAA